jgi:SAM-dependent methyltransferase/uncharacterized protein YbaR (Trm112 family)
MTGRRRGTLCHPSRFVIVSQHLSDMAYSVTELKNVFLLCCPLCKGALDADAKRCTACGHSFEFVGGIPSFVGTETRGGAEVYKKSDGENAFLRFFKQWPRFYAWMTLIVVPILYTGLTGKKFLSKRTERERMLNVGSGASMLHTRVLNVDIFPNENVHVLAHAEHLPFPDDTFDAVCSEQMLEHVFAPGAVVAEMLRVTKPGGLIYVAAPFMYPLHPSPKDYSRWTVEGLATMFSGHAVVDSGVLIGPISGTLSVLASGLAVICSFGITFLRKILHYFFMIVLTPLKLLDVFYARMPGAEDVAADVYVVIQK